MSHSRGSPRLTIIVAATQSMGIGAGGGLPWKLPGEMKYFARATTGSSSSSSSSPHPPPSSTSSSPSSNCWNSVIMGRKTWESIPRKFRPLKGRRNVIISRDPAGVDLSYRIVRDGRSGCEQTTAVGSLEEAIRAVSSLTSTSSSSSFTSPSPPTTTTTTQNPPPATPTNINYLIGGAQLYTLALQHDLVDRILFTRVLSPGFEGVCDVFLPDFSGGFRRKIGERQEDDKDHENDKEKEENKVNKEEDKNNKDEREKAPSVWKFKQRPHSALEEFVGFQVPEGEVEEKGVRYRFELWEREE
ncbi:hypothetical protein FFLO_01054 [Filobasidium floriforme]|uniref:Dihydrofolate reductase n=1 Tax=Filobasidium floriforme TaxID=5210 RepID=A0A8K0JQA0_9TREE|nr:hypothetical protein FFLO_01054 [Filobasidium floriforme]